MWNVISNISHLNSAIFSQVHAMNALTLIQNWLASDKKYFTEIWHDII